VAESDPDLWDDILFSNRQALLAAIARFDRRWRTLRRHLRHGNRSALRRFLNRAQSLRHALSD
jgi:prephenate dehydrogenase